MKKTIVLSLLLGFLGSCQKAEEEFPAEELARKDSLALHVAVFPTLEALPLYYAERTGMLRSDTMDIRLCHFASMTDCDTAIARGHVHAAFTDVARIYTLMREDSVRLTAVASTASALGLYSPRGKKIDRTTQLKERLVGIERHCQSDYWSDRILDNIDLTTLDIFRVQIGSTALRYDMLMNGLLDAAFLPQPYAALCADSVIAATLWTKPAEETSWTVLAVPAGQTTDSLRCRQMEQMQTIYEKARKQIAEKPDTALLHKIYREDYGILERHLLRTHWQEWVPEPLDSVHAEASRKAGSWLREERGLNF